MDKVLLAVKYVEGDLNEMEYKAFEDAVQQDGELREYLSYYKEINLNIGAQLKDVLRLPQFKKTGLETSYVGEKLTYGLDYLWYGFWLLVGIIALMVWKPWKTSLYDEFSLDNKFVASALASAPYQGFTEAAQYFEKKHYYEAKLIIAKLYGKNPNDQRLAYYYAMVLIADGRLETSREILQPLVKNGSDFKADAMYMMALSYLKGEDAEKCAQWLRRMPQEATHYQQSAQLLNKLQGSETSENYTLIKNELHNYATAIKSL